MTDLSRSTTTTTTKRTSQWTRRQQQGVFQIHDPVELHGVTVMPAFNGLVGRIHAFDPTSGIYTIRHELSDNNDNNNDEDEDRESSSSYAQVFRDQKATNGVLMTRLSAKFLRSCTIKVRQQQQQEQQQLLQNEKAVVVDAKKADTIDMKGATPINESTEWMTVARTKKNNLLHGSMKPRNLSAFNRQHDNSSNEDGPSDDDLLKALRECCNQLKSTFYWKNWTQTELFRNWKQSATKKLRMDNNTADNLSTPLLKSIVCYGIGNFGSTNPMVTKRSCWSPPLWQLALALTIQEALLEGSNSKKPSMLYFEPGMTPQEKRILEKVDIHILAKNEQGCRQVETTAGSLQGPHSTLFFMPHCPLSLYTNVLFTNWEWDMLQHVVLFGNKLSLYVENEWGNPSSLEVLKRLGPFWTEIALPTYTQDEDHFPSHYLQAFGDGALTYFFPASGAVALPERPLESRYVAENASGNEVV